jgi:hypothetical protein
MNISRASKKFVIYCRATSRSRRFARCNQKLLLRFIEANGDQDVSELSRSHLTLYLATELGEVRSIKLRTVTMLRREADMLIEFYNWLAVQGFCQPLHPNHLQSPFRRRKGFFQYVIN